MIFLYQKYYRCTYRPKVPDEYFSTQLYFECKYLANIDI